MTPPEKAAFDPFANEWDAFRQNPSSVLAFFTAYAEGKVLDAACGNGRNALELSKTAHVTALDISPALVDLARKNTAGKKIQIQQGDLAGLPFENETFDTVFCLAALHHLTPERQPKALEEFFRVLKSGGHLCLSVWNGQQPRFAGKSKIQNVPWKGHDRYYYFFDENELRYLAQKTGFAVEKTFFEKNGIERDARHGQNLCLVARKPQNEATANPEKKPTQKIPKRFNAR